MYSSRSHSQRSSLRSNHEFEDSRFDSKQPVMHCFVLEGLDPYLHKQRCSFLVQFLMCLPSLLSNFQACRASGFKHCSILIKLFTIISCNKGCSVTN